jgi:GDPmannose 4,6-dehydratase
MKIAYITGVTGQDGAYLSKYLLDNNYIVYGAYRRLSSSNFWRLKFLNILDNNHFHLVESDLTDPTSAIRTIEKYQPDEIYNLAAQSFVGVSFEQPITTAEITGLGAVYLLEAIRTINKKIKFYQASTSEMYGLVQEVPQSENTPFYPRSPYGVAKLYAHWMTVNYRESYDIFGASGILFNHESPLRGLEFVTRKITNSVAKIKLGQIDCFELGNIDAKRDWGFAGDYVEGMHKMLQAETPDTYVLSTGATTTVRDFVTMCFKNIGIPIEWSGSGINEVGINTNTGKIVVNINPIYYRPAEVDLLLGDPSKAKNQLGWESKMSLDELSKTMVDADIEFIKNNSFF